MKRILRVTLFIFTCVLALGFVDVFAQTDMTITRKTYIATETRQDAKFYTNKGYAYCITPEKNGAPQGSVLKYKSNEMDGGIIYLLNNTGESDTEYLTTQLALWRYTRNYMPQYYEAHKNTDLVSKAEALAQKASQNKNYAGEASTLSLTLGNKSLNYNTSSNVYRTDVITATLSNVSNIRLSLVNAPNGAKIVDANGSQINTISNGGKFYVEIAKEYVTATSNFLVKIQAATPTYAVERYADSASQWQELIVLVKGSKTVESSLNLTVTPKVFTCEKVANQYYDRNGNVVNYEKYAIQCEKHACEKIESTYFGSAGNVVSYEEYTVQCERHTCEKIGNKFFGKDGTEVCESEYTKQCVHVCEVYNGEYYDSKGYKVSENEYKNQCEATQVVVPDTKTSSSMTLFLILAGSTLLGSVIGVLEYITKKKISKVDKWN